VSYQVLARKWRPQNFSQVVGQQHVLTALSNGLAQNKVHHAYLFSGTRGVGKTTIARILAKSLNCEQGVTATPCGKCENCVAIDQGRFVDLLEIDAASRTKVDDTRELLDNVQYKPAVGRYKVYLIDEVHMLSKHSFNALLKTLEEPPEYVKFLLATTDPQKLPITVLSRCLQFHLKAILPEQIETQLAFILQQEQATFEHTALNVIAKAADGSMRDALSLTDQALAFGAGNIEYTSVLKMLGTLDDSHLEYLLHFIASGNVEKVFQKIEEFVALGADFAKLHQELASLCHQIALQQLQPRQTNGEKSAIQLISERLNPEEVQLYYQIAVQGFKDYNFAPNGKVALEMTVMRLLAFKPANYVELDESTLVNRSTVTELNATENAITATVAPAPIVTVEPVVQTTEPTTPVAQQVVQPSVPVEAPVINAPVVEEMPIAEATVAEPVNAEQATPVQAVIEQPVIAEPSIAPIAAPMATTETAMPSSEAMQSAPTVTPIQESVIQTAPPAVEQTPVSTADPVAQVTHSRNMLRSHRLKRDEIKKSQATTDPQSNNSVVAASPQPAPSVVQPVRTPAPAPIAPIAPVQRKPIATQQSSDHLPPLDQYQDSEFEANNFSNNYDDQYEPYIPPEMQQGNFAQSSTPQSAASQNMVPQSVAPQNTGFQNTPPQSSIPESRAAQQATPQGMPAQHSEQQHNTQQSSYAQRRAAQHNAQQSNPVQSAVQPPSAPMRTLNSNEGQLGSHAFFSNQAFEAPEIDTAKYVEDKLTDPWSLAIQKMGVVGLVKLLAKNSVMKKTAEQVVLTLKPGQQHLLNNSSLCEELQKQIKNHYGAQVNMYVEVGDVAGELTAFESEMELYEQYLNNAKRAIVEDENIKKLVANCGAKVYENSVIPL